MTVGPGLRTPATRRSLRAWVPETPPGTAAIVLPVVLGGGCLFCVALAGGLRFAPAAAAALVAATVAEAFPVPIERVTPGATSFATVFIVAAAAIHGWRAGVLVGALSMLLIELYHWRPMVKALYNASLYALAGAAAGGAASAASGPSRVVGTLAGAAAFYVVDVALVSLVVARTRREPYVRLTGEFFRSTLAPFTVMAATTGILVRLWLHSPYDALLLAAPMVAIVLYQRSLVAAMHRQRELDQLKDEFIATVSHELRTPLSSVYGSAMTLDRPGLSEEARAELLSVVRRESVRLVKLVDDVLWASRLERQRIGEARHPCNPVPLVREVVADAAATAPDNLSVRATLPEALPALAVEGDLLRRVLINLVDNAVKYSPDGGTVEVSAAAVDGSVRLVVSDQGLGIPEAERERIFDKFTRLDPQMTRGIGGTGLGLYICRTLVEQMGGTISVDGTPGGGSTFTVEIPVADAGDVQGAGAV